MSSATVRLPSRAALPDHVRPLITALTDPPACIDFGTGTWEQVVRVARMAQLLGTLAARIDSADRLAACPEPVRNHLRAALLEVRHVHQAARLEMQRLAATLQPLGVPMILLKGSSYIAQELAHARGRQLRDVDLMVPKSGITQAEAALLAAGWAYDTDIDEYDQHYYRAWSHQLAPLRSGGQMLELDLHHTILPPTGRVQPDAQALIDASRPISGSPFRALDPADQVIHAAVHLFQDSDCTSRLRDVVDIDALCRAFAVADPDFWIRLVQRAQLHGAERALWYSLAFARGWMATPLPTEASAALDRMAPPARSRNWVLHTAALSLPPPEPDHGPTQSARSAARRMRLRSIALRMPMHLLAYHAAMKTWRRLVRPRTDATSTSA